MRSQLVAQARAAPADAAQELREQKPFFGVLAFGKHLQNKMQHPPLQTNPKRATRLLHEQLHSSLPPGEAVGFALHAAHAAAGD